MKKPQWHIYFIYYFFFFKYLFNLAVPGLSYWHVGSRSPNRNQTWAPLHGELGVLATRPPGKSLIISFYVACVYIFLMIWVSWKHLVGRIRPSLLLSKVDPINQSIQFLTLNLCLEVFLFFPVIAGNRHRGLLPECLLREGLIIPEHMLPPDVAQSGLLDSTPTGTGSVNAWISLEVPWPPALLPQSVLLTKADNHHLS